MVRLCLCCTAHDSTAWLDWTCASPWATPAQAVMACADSRVRDNALRILCLDCRCDFAMLFSLIDFATGQQQRQVYSILTTLPAATDLHILIQGFVVLWLHKLASDFISAIANGRTRGP